MTDKRFSIWDVIDGKLPPPPCDQTLGATILEAKPGEVLTRFDARQEFLNPFGTVHGGFLAAMMDVILGQVLSTRLEPGKTFPTLELKISFIAPAKPGPILGRGRVVHLGNSIAFLEGRLFDDNKKLIATGSCTATLIKKNKPA